MLSLDDPPFAQSEVTTRISSHVFDAKPTDTGKSAGEYFDVDKLENFIKGLFEDPETANWDGPRLAKEISAQLSKDVRKRLGKIRNDYAILVKNSLSLLHHQVAALRANTEKLEVKVKERIKEQPVPEDDPISPQELEEIEDSFALRWGGDVDSIKQELHQMVFAHNHNAELMKRLKGAVDEAKHWLDEMPDSELQKSPQMGAYIDDFLKVSENLQRNVQSIVPTFDALQAKVAAVESRLAQRSPSSHNLYAMGVEMRSLDSAPYQNEAPQWDYKLGPDERSYSDDGTYHDHYYQGKSKTKNKAKGGGSQARRGGHASADKGAGRRQERGGGRGKGK